MSVVDQYKQYEFPVDLDRFPESDGVPLETLWHWWAMTVLLQSTYHYFRRRRDFHAAGNNFIYWDPSDPRKVVGSDYYFVWGVRRVPPEARPMWCVWVEGGRFPNVIIELLSKKTARLDRTTKKTLYERTFRTDEYFLCDYRTRRLDGFRLLRQAYVAIEPDERGWLWSQQLGLWVGTWEGEIEEVGPGVWVRFYDPQGRLVLRANEYEKLRSERARKRAAKQEQRAEAAEAELSRLQALLNKQQKANGRDGASRRSKG